MKRQDKRHLERLRVLYPGKFTALEEVFSLIYRGTSIFIGSSCGEPQYLIQSLVDHVESKTHRIYGSRVIHVWTLGVAPYTQKKFEENFRHNSFFISDSSRDVINRGLGDYTPVHLSEIPRLFRQGKLQVDVAFVQVSLPDENGNMSLGVSVDIVREAVDHSKIVVAQVNSHMPYVSGDSLVGPDDVDYLVPHDEPLLEYRLDPPDDTASEIGRYVARIVRDGDTLQVGYGEIPNAILSSLRGKKDLGIHTELLTDGVIDLITCGAVNNSRKSVDPGRTVASFCMGTADTYSFIDNNEAVEMRPIDYTNSPFVISRHDTMTAINTSLQIDLSGQSTAESLGTTLYSGVGGQADFMRGAALSSGGKSILTMRSTSNDGKKSRIVPVLDSGASTTLTRADVQYVVTEHGIAYLYGKNIRDRALSLITIAHPKFREWLLDEAKKLGLVQRDQESIDGAMSIYPAHLETYRKTGDGLYFLLRPVKVSDEENLKLFFYSLSDQSLYTRFFSTIEYVPRKTIRRFAVIDYSKEMTILAVLEEGGTETVIGIGQYVVEKGKLAAEISLLVRDDFQNRGIGGILMDYVFAASQREGILEMSATVLKENAKMLHLFYKTGLPVTTTEGTDTVRLTMPLA